MDLTASNIMTVQVVSQEDRAQEGTINAEQQATVHIQVQDRNSIETNSGINNNGQQIVNLVFQQNNKTDIDPLATYLANYNALTKDDSTTTYESYQSNEIIHFSNQFLSKLTPGTNYKMPFVIEVDANDQPQPLTMYIDLPNIIFNIYNHNLDFSVLNQNGAVLSITENNTDQQYEQSLNKFKIANLIT